MLQNFKKIKEVTMNNIKRFSEIIEKKRELTRSKKPRYATRKLTIGLVSCMLGFTLIFLLCHL